MATIEDLHGVLESMNISLTTQTELLTSMVEANKEAAADAARADRLSQESKSISSNSGGIGNALTGAGNAMGGLGGLLGGAGKGIGIAGLGIGAALLGLGTVLDKFDPESIKSGVETLLSIGEGYESRTEFLKENGSLGLALAGIGAGLAIFSVGQGAAALAQWASNDDWAQKVKDNVSTLLSIGELNSFGSAGVLFEGSTLGAALSGLGVGLAIFSVGQGAAALAQWATDDDWAQKVKDNVETLLSIGESEFFGSAGVLVKGGLLGASMIGLGAGLAVFSVGQAAQGLAQFVTDDDWAQKVKDNIETLLSIGTLNFWDTAGLVATMGGLGLGLAAFALGKGVEGTTEGIQEAVEHFSKGGDFAQRVKNEVETLLSISELPGVSWSGVGTFIGVMAGLGAGLAAFALGKGAEGIAEVGQEGLSYFTDQTGFAERVKSEVETLLSIAQLPGVGADTTQFVTTMGGLALGLAAFALGKGVEGLAEGGQEALSYFTGQEPYAERIKSEVETLMGITSLTDEGRAEGFANAMRSISSGLISFGSGDFVGTLASAGASIVSFFTGATSPFEQIRIIADEADALTKGADALDRLSIALDRIGELKFDGSNLRLRDFAEDLLESIPVIEKAIMGGTIDNWGPFNTTLRGLASPDVNYDEATRNITMLRSALGYQTRTEAITAAAVESGQGVGGTTVIGGPTDARQIDARNQSSTTIINQTVNPSGALDPASPF